MKQEGTVGESKALSGERENLWGEGRLTAASCSFRSVHRTSEHTSILIILIYLPIALVLIITIIIAVLFYSVKDVCYGNSSTCGPTDNRLNDK
jgi:nitrogen fixation-related uncharacterized protein